MKKSAIQLVLIFLFFFGKLSAKTAEADTARITPFGKVTIYKPAGTPVAFVVFFSGDGGWNKGVVDMAKNIVDQGALVVGIDIQHYFKALKSQKSKCYYPAGDVETLSLLLQKKYHIRQYLKPILVGYSSGATLVYGILAQAPANTFKGAIALGFCPDIDLDRTLCNGSGLTSHVLKEGKSFYLDASEKLTAPFVVLLGPKDQVCSYDDTRKYIEKIPKGELITLPKVGHGFSVTANWLPQFKSAFTKIVNAPGYSEQKAKENIVLQKQQLIPLPGDLPITLIPADKKDTLPIVLMISGDGGWTSFDQTVCESLADKGMSVIGLDAQKYFWNERKPEETALDISKAVAHFMQQWNKKSFLLMGYSFGACAAPFIAEHFHSPISEALKGVYCLSPDEHGDFEIHITDMLSIDTEEKYNVIAELKKIKSLDPVCIFGEDEDDNVRKQFVDNGITVITLPGSHHYNNDFNAITEDVLKYLRKERK
jgi:type IV secretory pathway VirJ component